MTYDNKNLDLIKKIEKWQGDPTKFDLEQYLIKNKNKGFEYSEVLADLYVRSGHPEKILNVFVEYLKQDAGVVKCIEHICYLINETTPDSENVLGLLLLLNELKNDDPHVLSMIVGVYQEYGWSDRVLELMGDLPKDANVHCKIDYYSKLLYSEIQENIEKSIPFFKELNIKELPIETWVGLGSMKFYSGAVKDGLLYHFGGEDFRPQEFINSYDPVSINEDLSGKKIILTPYRGMGDSMILSRFLPKFIKKYPDTNITVCTEPSLVSLYEEIEGLDFVGTPDECAGISYDMCLGINHIAHYLRDELVDSDDNCKDHEWVKYQSRYDEKWKERIKINDRPIIGINWKGSMTLGGGGRSSRNTSRDLNLDEFINVVDQFPSYTFIALNPDISEEEHNILKSRTNVIIPDGIKNFGDTSALINMCDVVVSTDTSISTLSASLSKNTIVMAKFWPDYRWLYYQKWWDLDKVDIEVFRKKNRNASWTTVLFDVIRSLKKYDTIASK